MLICRHCNQRKVSRPRGLCWTCYYSPGVRDLFPSTSKYSRRGIEDFIGQAAPPPNPTAALPGSEEKIAVLMERARSNQGLWHPNDAHEQADFWVTDCACEWDDL